MKDSFMYLCAHSENVYLRKKNVAVQCESFTYIIKKLEYTESASFEILEFNLSQYEQETSSQSQASR
jgi:hypothetical protein